MKVTELQAPIKEVGARPKYSEAGSGLKKNAKSHLLQPDRFTNQGLSEADHQTCKLADEIRAMQVALVEYQRKESKWRQEDREWLKEKEAELMKNLQQFEEITNKVLQFLQVSDSNLTRPVAASEDHQHVSEKASLLCVASRRSIDGGEGEIMNESLSEIHLTDSEIYQELKEADEKALKTAGEIRAIRFAVSEYHSHKENCIWMKKDTEWLEEKQTELMQKLAEFEEVTKRFLRFIGLADISTTQFVFPGEVVVRAAVLKDNNKVDGEQEEKSTDNSTDGDDGLKGEPASCSEVSIHEQIKEADEYACKTAQEIQELKSAIDNYQKQISSGLKKEDAKWLERKKSELISKFEEFEVITFKVKQLVGLAAVSTTKSTPVNSRSTPESENTNKEDYNGSTWQPETIAEMLLL